MPQSVVTYVPLVIGMGPGKMILSITSSKVKALTAAVFLVLYIYFLICLKTLYVKIQKLDELQAMAMVIAKKIRNVEMLNEKLKKQIAEKYNELHNN